jgi:hypothetical protein
MNQTTYINQILTCFSMSDCTPVSTPLAVKHNLSASQSPKTEAKCEEYLKFANSLQYLEMVGALLYTTQTHPKIQHSVCVASQFCGNPGKPHLEAVKHILHYLKGTAHFVLMLGRNQDGSVDLVGWTDSDWVQDPDTQRSIRGFVFDIVGGSVSWSAKKQLTVILSTLEAEYMAASNATKEAIWLQVLLEDLGYPQAQATTILSMQTTKAASHLPTTLLHIPMQNTSTFATTLFANVSREKKLTYSFVPPRTCWLTFSPNSFPTKLSRSLGVLLEWERCDISSSGSDNKSPRFVELSLSISHLSHQLGSMPHMYKQVFQKSF